MGNNFEPMFEALPTIGWLTKPEAKLLWETALDGGQDILEIGTYCGRSAVLLAQAIKQKPLRRLFCCDPFLAGFDGMVTPSADEIFLTMARGLLTGASALQVHICWQTEEGLKRHWDKNHRLSLLYLDGCHSYEATLGALRRWAPLADVVALHDYGRSHPGVAQAVKSYETLWAFSLKAVAGNLAVFQ